MYRPRFMRLPLALGLLAGLGFMAAPPAHVAAEPRVVQVATRRATRRTSARTGGRLPSRKGSPQKHHGKACRHAKPARSRRRALRMKR
ncbi:hypothetical protein [Frateuria sp. YIM B11624]|uniref:hypothetical protein n=1 Tax=Frateuria sp. YIM B11624 TaxID=3143185 RepID=UPI003C70807F